MRAVFFYFRQRRRTTCHDTSIHSALTDRPESQCAIYSISTLKACIQASAYIVTISGSEKNNLSGITSANLNRSGSNLADMHRSRGDNVEKYFGCVGAKWELSPARVFFCPQNQTPVQLSFRQIWSWHLNLCLLEKCRGRYLKNVPFNDHLPSKSSKLKGWRVSNRYLTLTSLHPRVDGCQTGTLHWPAYIQGDAL